MIKSNHISYSSVNRAGTLRRNYCGLICCCCNCQPLRRLKTLFKSCFRLPWSVLIAVLLSAVGIGLVCFSLVQSTVISDQLTYELFNRKYLWLNDLEVAFTIVGFFISLLVLFNFIIGCVTKRQVNPKYKFTKTCYESYCSHVANCMVKSLFVINYALLVIVIIAAMILGICLFAAFTTSTVCLATYHDEDNVDAVNTSIITSNNNQTRDSLNLLVFQPFIELPQNETQLLILTGSRLVKFCDHLVPSALTYVKLCFTGLLLLVIGLLNFILTININWTKISTKRKHDEVVFLNSAELTNFDEMD